MDKLRGKYRVPYEELGVRVGSNTAVLEQSFVAESIQDDEHKDDGLNAARGAVNAVLISIVLWIAIGLAIFAAL
jgi:hypothetical protein